MKSRTVTAIPITGGKFVATADKSVFGKTLSLGVNTTADEITEDYEENFQNTEEESETDQIQEI